MRIALDAMGGDYAPSEIVKGAAQFVNDYPEHEVLLVGDEVSIKKYLPRQLNGNLEIVHASEVVEMDEHPVDAIRKKRNSSIVVCADLVRSGEAQGMVSAGNTGATMASSLLRIGRIKGIDRPAIGSPMPTLTGVCTIVDAGANADCRPKHLLDFAIMGSIYMEKVLGVANPKVGLLNIGEEPTKGNELALAAYELLDRADNINFIGNIEGRDILAGKADVVVCDGFVGNVILKFAEGMGSALFSLIKEEVMQSWQGKLGGLLVRDGLRRVKQRVDYTEYGGAPLLGVKGVTIISHGSSNHKAIYNALRVAMEAEKHQVVPTIAANIVGADGKE